MCTVYEGKNSGSGETVDWSRSGRGRKARPHDPGGRTREDNVAYGDSDGTPMGRRRVERR